jgi:hypothetical protein
MVLGPYGDSDATSLGLIRGGSEFPSIQGIFLCLIEVNSAVKVIHDSVTQCLIQYKNSSYQDISPGFSLKNLWMRTKILQNLVIIVFFMQPVC